MPSPSDYPRRLAQSIDNIIGGNTVAQRNVISGNAARGVDFGGTSNTNGNVVAGNYVGTDVTGTLALGNIGDGVKVEAGGRSRTSSSAP